MATLLKVKDLRTTFFTTAGVLRAVDGVSWDVEEGETVALVGESGCGKSVSALSIMRLIDQPAGRIESGEILFKGRNLLALSEEQMRGVRGREIAMIFQEPMTSLNPVLTIGRQLTEGLEIHMRMKPPEARARALELLAMVGIPDPERRLGQYPHHFSGGMRQRMMIAMALACNPSLILADEPTTALDVTIQAQILELMRDLSRRLGVAMLIITHNLGVVARYADRVNVMYAGRIIERASAAELYATPRHPYTLGLLRSVPRLDEPRRARLAPIEGQPPDMTRLPPGCSFAPRCAFRVARCPRRPRRSKSSAPRTCSACWEAARLAKEVPGGGGSVSERCSSPRSRQAFPGGGRLARSDGVGRAVDGVSFTLQRGETLGLVGESGCGKTTTGRCVLLLERPTSGEVVFEGIELTTLPRTSCARCAGACR